MDKSELKRLLQELMLGIQSTLTSGGKLSDEFQGLLAQTIEKITSKLRQNEESLIQSAKPTLPLGTDLLWYLSGGNVDAFRSYLSSYPGKGLAELANNPTQFQLVVNLMQQTNPLETQGEPSNIKSSNVKDLAYDEDTNRLLVRFHGEKAEPLYAYEGVPPHIFDLLRNGNAIAKTSGKNQWGEWWTGKTPSVGAALDQYLKKAGYTYHKLT